MYYQLLIEKVAAHVSSLSPILLFYKLIEIKFMTKKKGSSSELSTFKYTLEAFDQALATTGHYS